MNSERWFSVTKIAEYLDVKPDTIYKWLAKDKIPAHKVGKLWRFDVNEIDHWIRSGGAAEKKVSKGHMRATTDG